MTLALGRRPLARPSRPRAKALHASSRAPRAAAAPAAWEVRSFAIIATAIIVLFALALLYLSHTTAVSAGGYETQRLAGARDELRRQNSLLEVQVARLDSPTRIETDARNLGLVRAKVVPVVSAETLAARR